MTSRRLAPLLVSALLAGCAAVGPNYQRPSANTPAAFKNAPASTTSASPEKSSTITSAWWSVFDDPVLNKLETDAILHNQQLTSAVARMDEARARLGIARADRSATLNTLTTAKLAGESSERTLPLPGRPISYRDRGDSYRVPFDAVYEVDVWGRVRRLVESADAQASASENDLIFIQLTLTAEVAQTWFSARSFAEELSVVQRTIALRREQLDLSTKRFEAGLTSELDVVRGRAELAGLEAESIDLQRRRELTLNALALLTGTSPAGFSAPTAPSSLSIPPAIPAGLPSDLLTRRPDIISAERQLAARTADIGVAKAAFFPTLRLTGSAGVESNDLGALLNHTSQFWQIVPSLSYNFFDGGKNRAGLEAAEARARGALADYQQKVLVAFREVEDALIDLRQQAEQASALDRALAANQEATALASRRYEKGLVSYFEVIDAQRALLATNRTITQLTAARHLATIRLIKSLGGSWTLQN